MENLRKALTGTDWTLFEQQKAWLARFEGKSEEAAGLLVWIDAVQDSAVEDGLLEEDTVFPSLHGPAPEEPFWMEWEPDDGRAESGTFASAQELLVGMTKLLGEEGCQEWPEMAEEVRGLQPGEELEAHLANGRLYFGLVRV